MKNVPFQWFLWLLIPQLFMVCPLRGQTVKTTLTTEEYAQWGIVGATTLSPSAQYVSYQLVYPQLSDTLFVHTAKGKKVLTVPKGHSGHFLNDAFFGCSTAEGVYQLHHLKTGVLKERNQVQYAQPLKNNCIMLIKNVPEKKEKSIEIIRYDGTTQVQITDVTAFKVSPNQSDLLVVQNQDTLYSLSLWEGAKNSFKRHKIQDSAAPILNPIWQSNGASLAYFTQAPDTKTVVLHQYDRQNQTAKKHPLVDPIFATYTFEAYNALNFSIANDGSRIFFYLMQKSTANKAEDPTVVEVWNAEDQQVYAHSKRYGFYGKRKLGVWELPSNHIRILGTDDESLHRINANQRFAIMENSTHYLPTTQQIPEKDYTVYDLNTGKQVVWLEKQPLNNQDFYYSPDGHSVVYVKNEQWGHYDFEKQKHQRLDYLPSSFMNTSKNTEERVPYGVAGWSSDSRFLFLYDAYDVWQIALEDHQIKRLTQGRETQITYRIVHDKKENRNEAWFQSETTVIDLDQEILLSMASENQNKTGFAVRKPNGKCTTLIFEAKKNAQAQYNRSKQQVIFQREDFNLPPQIVVADLKTNKTHLVLQSNPQHFFYSWGKSERIQYQNKKGNTLQGTLYYPFQYQKGKKYPLIVQIYEQLSHQVHTYTYPSYYNSVGFNTANLTGKGYFVLQPDIQYDIGNPGFSAVDCVEAAVRRTLEKGDVDAQKVGLIGQSFGGYETFFISSQSQLFATAIAGAGVSDMRSMYLTLGVDTAIPDAWRFEHQQFRMGKSFFDSPEKYLANSALHYAPSFSIPILTWTGTQDHTVDAQQSMQWYIAMRRLQKKHTMLRYPKQGHALSNPTQQKDLTLKIQQWFDYYLKEGERHAWMIPN